jgi:hypothetical protein
MRDDLRECGRLIECMVANREADAWVVLIEHHARAHGEMAYFAIAHFAPGETNGNTRGLEAGEGVGSG